MPPSPSHGRLHPDDLSRTHTHTHRETVNDGGIPQKYLLTASSTVQLWAKIYPAVLLCFCLFRKCPKQEPITALLFLEMIPPTFTSLSAFVLKSYHIYLNLFYFHFLHCLRVKNRPVGVWMEGCGSIFCTRLH